MAEETVPAQQPKKGNLFKIVLIVLLLIIVIAASVGATLLFMRKTAAVHPADAKPKPEKSVPKKKALYLSLDPPLVVNFQGNNRVNYLQVGIDIMSYDQNVLDDIKKDMPVLRNNLIMLFTGQSFKTLSTRDGRQKLRIQVLKAVRGVLGKDDTKEASKVQAVYFTSFVMQ